MNQTGQSPDDAFPLREISRRVHGWIDRLGVVWVTGQIVEVKQVRSMCYMVLRDPGVEVSMDLKCSVEVYRAGGEPGSGASVAVQVKVDFFEKNGRLSLHARQLQVVGEGRLLAQLDARRRMLQSEGLFDPALKKRLPYLPRGIGVVTAQNSAAERDVVVNITQRWPQARLVMAHARMQGPSSAAEVIAALRRLDEDPTVDVIIIARGGGSLEDLLPFSDEGLVRAVAAASTPVVTAIGHETDTVLIDYAADLRCSTPTGAAKAVVPDAAEELRRVGDLHRRLDDAVLRRLTHEQTWLHRERQSPVLREPSSTVSFHEARLTELTARLDRAIDATLRQETQGIVAAHARVVAMSPKATLQRGYAIVAAGDGAVATAAEVAPGDDLHIYLADGTLSATVTETNQTPEAP